MKLLLLVGLYVFGMTVSAQPLVVKSNLQLSKKLQQLENGRKLLYVSFLPGDENARLLAVAGSRYHLNTAVFWMSRGEGMHNYNGPEKGIDLGIIHVAEMEAAASTGGHQTFVSSCKDLGGRDTAAINATLPTDRLILDLATVIRQYRLDGIIIGHNVNSLVLQPGFSEWMDSICLSAVRVAGGRQWLTGRSLTAFQVPVLLADNTPVGTDTLQEKLGGSGHEKSVFSVSLGGIDPISGSAYRQMARESKLHLRSIYPDLDHIAIRTDTAQLTVLENLADSYPVEKANDFFTLFCSDTVLGVWNRLQRAGIDVAPIQSALAKMPGIILSPDSAMPEAAATLHEAAGLLMQLQRDENPGQKRNLITERRKGQAPAGETGFTDLDWVGHRLLSIRESLAGPGLTATADRELGVLGQDFRLKVQRHRPANGASSVLGIRVPGWKDSLIAPPKGSNEHIGLLLDTSLHIALMQAAYQPFWLNKPMRSDGSYQIDNEMQGRLSDTTSYQVQVVVVSGTDTLSLNIPVYYRHFDRVLGQIERPFYTIEPVLVSQTPTVLLTHVERDMHPVRQKELYIHIKTLFKDTAQVILFKVRQVGIQAIVNGQQVQSDSASMVYQDAGYISPEPGARTKVGWVLNSSVIDHLNPLTPILKPTVLLKLPEGVQTFSSNIKSVGYSYQSPRIYNYHSQTLVVGDTIHAGGGRILYLNGLSGDVFENAFGQLGFQVQQAGFRDFTSWIDEVDLNSNAISSMVTDSLRKLDVIVISGADEVLPTDSIQLQRLHYILNAYMKGGGRLINLNADPSLQKLLPLPGRVHSQMLVAGAHAGPIQVDSLSMLLNTPNKVPASFFRNWQGVMSRGVLPVQSGSISYPLQISFPEQNNKELVAPLDIQYLNNGILVNCFMELAPALSNGKAAAYKFLANLLVGASPKKL